MKPTLLTFAGARGSPRSAGGRVPPALNVRGLLGAWLLLGSCNPRSAQPVATLDQLERLAFVPAYEGQVVLRDGLTLPFGSKSDLLVDRYEVSRAEWSRFRAQLERGSGQPPAPPGPSGSASSPLPDPAPGSSPDPDAAGISPEIEPARPDPSADEFVKVWDAKTHDWPASWMTLDEARACARWRGLRLLSASEWLRVACGERPQPYPWGPNASSTGGNTVEFGLGRPMAVGTFESGRGGHGIYDLTGNVWEWVEGALPEGLAREPDVAVRGRALGGSYLSRLARTYDVDVNGRLVLNQLELDPNMRVLDVGLRCAIEAEPYLELHAQSWNSNADSAERLRRIGREWGSEAAALLERLASKHPGLQGLRWLAEGARQ